MSSYKDYEELWSRYQSEGVPKNISIVTYCESMGIVYRHFEKWYKQQYKKKAYPIQLENVPEHYREQNQNQESPKQPSTTSRCTLQVEKIHLVLSNGLEYHQRSQSLTSVIHLLKKLESLCLE